MTWTTMLCPICSSNQCHRHGWCTYKVQLQRFKCNQCNKRFTTVTAPDLPRYRHSLRTVSLAVKFYARYGLSFRKVAEALHDLFNLKISEQIVNFVEIFCTWTDWMEFQKFEQSFKIVDEKGYYPHEMKAMYNNQLNLYLFRVNFQPRAENWHYRFLYNFFDDMLRTENAKNLKMGFKLIFHGKFKDENGKRRHLLTWGINKDDLPPDYEKT